MLSRCAARSRSVSGSASLCLHTLFTRTPFTPLFLRQTPAAAAAGAAAGTGTANGVMHPRTTHDNAQSPITPAPHYALGVGAATTCAALKLCHPPEASASIDCSNSPPLQDPAVEGPRPISAPRPREQPLTCAPTAAYGCQLAAASAAASAWRTWPPPWSGCTQRE